MKKRTKCMAWILAAAMIMPCVEPVGPVSAAISPADEVTLETKSVDPSLIQNDGSILLADFNFDEAQEDGSFIGGIAKATGDYELQDRDGYGKTLYLDGNGKFLTVTKSDGTPLLTDQEDITISYDVKPGRSVGTNWDFFISDGTEPKWNNEHYLGACVNTGNGNIDIERYDSANIKRPTPAKGTVGSEWTHIDVEVKESSTLLYINGILAEEMPSKVKLSDIIEDSCQFQIGKADWVPNEFSVGWIDNFKVYDNTLKNVKDTLDLGITGGVKNDIALPVISDKSVDVSWESDNPSVLAANGTVTRADEDTDVKLTATISKDGYATTKEFFVKVLKKEKRIDIPENSILLVDFDFDKEEQGGGFVGAEAKAVGTYSLDDHEDGKAVYFDESKKQSLLVTAKDGSPILNSQDEIIISYDVKPDKTGTNWDFFISDGSKPASNKEYYLGAFVNGGNTTIERYNGGARPALKPSAATGNNWIHVDVVVKPASTLLYIDGELKADVESEHKLSSILKNACKFQIGKADWGNGEYSKGWIDNFKVYDHFTLQNAAETLEIKDINAVKSDLELPTSLDNGISVEWLSDNPSVIANDGKVNALNYDTSIKLTATLSKLGVSVKKDFDVKVLRKEKKVKQSSVLEDGSILLTDLNFDVAEADGSFIGGETKATGTYTLADKDGGKAVYFNGKQQFLSLIGIDGTPVLNGQETITITYDVKPDNSSTNWDFYVSDTTDPQPWGNTEHYIGACVNPGISTKIERYLNTGTRPACAEASTGSDWTRIKVEFTETYTKLYVNDELKATQPSTYKLSDIVKTNGIFQIGKANWGGGEYSKGYIDNFKVYDNTLKAAKDAIELGDLSAVVGDITLPTEVMGVPVTWESTVPEAISTEGKVTRTYEDIPVTLTATMSAYGVKVNKEFQATVAKKGPKEDIELAKKALNMLSVTDKDLVLPSDGILDTAITWKSDDTTIMTDDGHIVSRPSVGAGNSKVTMTATFTLTGVQSTKDFEIEVMEEPYGYVMGYIRGTDDRNGSLHLAYSKDGNSFTALNGNSGVLFAGIDTNNTWKKLDTGICFNGACLFRQADGSFGFVAPQGNDKKSVYLYDSNDLLTYTNERLIRTNADKDIVSAECGYDTLIGAYRINWTDGNKTYSNISDNLMSLDAAEEYTYTPTVNSPQDIPEGAQKYSIIPVTKSEYEKLLSRFDVVQNTGIESVQNSIDADDAADVMNQLPKYTVAHYSDGSDSALPIKWDTDSIDFTDAGTYTVNGKISTYTNPLIEERADPQIYYDDTENCYYFTASYPAKNNVNNGYDRIILRKADSIEGLSDEEGGLDKEITIWNAPASGPMAKHVWAPELHKINGKWYVFFAAGNSDNVWAIRPYVLVCQGDDPYVAANWKKTDGQSEIYPATSKDKKYFMNMSLDMTYFEHNGKHYVIWADIIGQSALYMQEINPQKPWEGISDKVVMLTTPEYGWERDSERVNEGATILKHDGKIFCAFSASGTGPEYCIGMLYADEDSDLMDADSWTKLGYPLLTSADVPGEYGPGHNSFTVDAEGNPVFVYHARSEECYNNECKWANADPLYDPCRHARVKNVHWNAEGLPILKMSAEDECPSELSNLTITVKVANDSQKDLANAVIKAPTILAATGSQLKPEVSISYKNILLEKGTDYTVKYGENTDPGQATILIEAVEGSRFTGSRELSFEIVEEVNAIVHYDMTREGNSLVNKVSDTLNGKLVNVSDSDSNTYKGVTSLSLDKKSYVELPSGIITDNTFTVSITAATPVNNSTQWLLGLGKDNWNYVFFTPVNASNNTKFAVAQSEPNGNTGAYAAEKTIQVGSEATSGIYQTYTLIVNGSKTEMYINGNKVGESTNPFDMSTIIPTSDIIGYIGKSLYSSDPLFKGNIADFAVYDEALTSGQVKFVDGSKDVTANITADIYSNLFANNTDSASVKADLNLPSKVDGVNLIWTTPQLIDTDGTVHRPIGGSDVNTSVGVVYKWNGKTVTENFELTIKSVSDSELDEIISDFRLPYSTVEGQEVYGNITLPDSFMNGIVTWEKDSTGIVDVNAHDNKGAYANDPTPAGKVTRPSKDTDVTLKATIDFGNNVKKTKDFTFTVKAAPKKLESSDFTDYLFAYFTGEGFSDGEQIYFSSSEDGLHWNELNNSKPYLTSTLGEQGVRDPFIFRSAEGDKFYMIATDLKINNGNGWGAAQTAGSQALMVWESTDLVNWSKQRMVTISAGINAGCTWAPEATYDEITGEYVVYWASRTESDGYAKQRVYYAKTRDFYSFTEPQIFIEKSTDTIDTTILKENGSYYRFSKNETNKNIISEKMDTLLHSTPVSIDMKTLQAQGGVEGPSIFKFCDDDVSANGYKYCLLVDNYGGIGYYPMVSNDLDGDFTRLTEGYTLPASDRKPRHGTPMQITAAEYEIVMQAMAEKTAATEIKVGENALEGFDPAVFEYSVKLNANDAVPTLTAKASVGASVVVTQGTIDNPVATVTVKESGKASVEYKVTFTGLLKNVTITYEAGDGGKIDGTAVQIIKQGQSTSIVTAVANAGYEFKNWSDGSTSISRNESNVTESKTIKANFQKKAVVTKAPTEAPTKAPTKAPTNAPTKAPTEVPTKEPTLFPTNVPSTKAPTTEPIKAPTTAPTVSPTTQAPTAVPTVVPTVTPTQAPILTIKAEADRVNLNVKSGITIGLKEKVRFKATVLPENTDQKVTWKTSNSSIVTVSDSGMVTGKKIGNATITASTNNGKSCTCKVTVKAAPTKIKCKSIKKSLKKGKTFKIKTSLTSGSASYRITYKSSKKSIVVVSANGVVKAKATGKAVITVTTYNGKKSKIKIIVK